MDRLGHEVSAPIWKYRKRVCHAFRILSQTSYARGMSAELNQVGRTSGPNILRNARRLTQCLLPGSLAHAGDFALVGQLAEADTADAVVAQVRVGAAADLAAVVACGWRTWLAACCLRIIDFLAIVFSSLMLCERSADQGSAARGLLRRSWRWCMMTMSMPRILSILSYSISGKISCSLMPRA